VVKSGIGITMLCNVAYEKKGHLRRTAWKRQTGKSEKHGL